MKKRGGWIAAGLLVLAAGLLGAALTALALRGSQQEAQFALLEGVCREVVLEHPESKEALLDGLRGYRDALGKETAPQGGFLTEHGYEPSDFFMPSRRWMWGAAAGIAAALLLFGVLFWRRQRYMVSRIEELTVFLEQVNGGSPGVLLQTREDAFAGLQDELHKTVTALKQSRDLALSAQRNYGENLANIAHQLKTPVTALSLSNQLLSEKSWEESKRQMQKQLASLTRLEEALLLLSRLDAGALSLSRRSVDVFTLLSLAAEQLEELLLERGVEVDIPELGAVEIQADMEWTMEAIMNLLKNCMEHTPAGGCVHCFYEGNPLYVEIRIWDEGSGFAREDLPYLFERFYRGKGEGDGIGIGLSLARAIFEQQNGTIWAQNLPQGGACFEIHMYCH